jgi:ribosomal protein S18 acetylase RimI-like enzyme
VKTSEHIIETPWDSRVFGMKTYEITFLSEDVLEEIQNLPGHFTVRVDPLSSKRILHDYGFYYCDTLVEPYCTPEKFIAFEHPSIYISRSVIEKDLIAIAHGAFLHGRFHRDFWIKRKLADLRYDMWLRDLYNSGDVLGLMCHDEVAGFFGLSTNKIVLHALSEEYRGKGLAKYFWSAGCREMFHLGYREITSSVSASNVTVLNVYSSLGFRFRNPLDIYHRFNK